MLPSIPVLADYGLSPTHGFLPDVLPLTRLPDPYYTKWEAIVANLQALILSKRLRGVVDRLPVLSTIGLEHDAEWRRAYSLLTFMAHAYIWGGDSPSDRLPPPIAVPLLEVSARLEVLPVATYASLCLWNFKPLFMDEAIDNLENLATLNTFTGSLDESWFYLVSVAIEARGAPIIPLMLTAMAAARAGDAPTVTRCLRTFAERLDDLGTLLQRMNESCDPTIFYHRIRPFLAGSKNMAEAGLPDGVVYEDGSGTETYRQYSGGSNAQSSIIQFFDIALGVDHHPTGDRRSRADSFSDREGRAAAPRHNFIMEMRKYMPGPHARFLNDVQAVANIRDFVEDHQDDVQLCIAYDACLSMLRVLRDKHIAIVTRYIVVPSREVRARSRSRSPEATRRRVNLATASSSAQQRRSPVQERRGGGPQGIAFEAPDNKKGDLKGTGGTALMSFLKQARDETGEPTVEEWARRFISRVLKAEGRNDFFFGKPEEPVVPGVGVATEEVEVAGLAGTWTIDDDVGGICHY
ncbi:Indoleamine 2,3-dioxygenase [Coniochaeta hoffmannii]|uniref:Indoleamine 2,3-dioxygenase n=1 Tax=Coniochaeta hoffmannii TaxID=91930 RepID=A0AA38RY41_9PEZI|nr:Indoleamine 2,3-dioxygenase [Coniochaeta hoffmannii]